MSRSYFYFVASLPYIEFDSKLPMSMDDFLSTAERLLPPDDYEKIRTVLEDGDAPKFWSEGVLDRWLTFERNLRNGLASQRAARLGKDPSDHIRGKHYPQPLISEIIEQATQSLDPLTAERVIDKARWQYLEELQQGHYYDFDSLVVYALKLKILERYHYIRAGHGKERLEEYEKIDINV